MTLTKDQVLTIVKEEKIELLHLWFCDILGILKGFAITPRELEGALEQGMGFDGSSIEGFARIEESDLMALPDPSTFTIIPPELSSINSARLFCNLKTPEGDDYPGDPRAVLRRLLDKYKTKGYTFNVGPEPEFFYLKDDKCPAPLDAVTYFDSSMAGPGAHLKQETIRVLEAMGMLCEYSHHEVAPSQHEIDLRYTDALTMADNVITFKFVVKQVALNHNLYATFLPKPINGVNGSGMHTHQSIFQNGRNLFFDPKDKYHLSAFARHYTAGIIHYIKEITAVLNQSVNSYKRIAPGFEAPCYIMWGQKNRSALIRVPRYRIGRENSTRIELRSPDPICNPYLAFACMLEAGMRGVEQKMPLGEPFEEDAFAYTLAELEGKGIESLPGDLYSAIIKMRKSDLVREVLGEHIFSSFVQNKLIEWDRYRTRVTDYEIDNFLPIF